jgi:hypothetical protein
VDELLDERRRSPRDNLLSALIAAEEAGELLTDAELQSTVVPFDVSRPCPRDQGQHRIELAAQFVELRAMLAQRCAVLG